MFTTRFTDFLNGYIEIKITGGFPERFINLCNANKINIYNVKFYGESVTACTDIDGFKRMRPFAAKSGTKIKLIKKHGLPFFIFKNRNRIGIPCGIAAAMLVLVMLSGRIWTVKVEGNNTVPEEKIIRVYEKLGVKNGIKKTDIKASEISDRALKYIDEISWSAVNIDGCCATIEVKEKIPVPKNEGEEKPSNIVAGNSGQIVLLENFSGTPLYQIGDAVEKGDVIISGAVENKDLSVNFLRAKGNVKAKTVNNIEVSETSIKTMKIFSKPKRKLTVNIFVFNIPVFNVKSDKNFLCVKDKNMLEINQVEIPVGAKINYYTDIRNGKINRSDKMRDLICTEKFYREVCELNKKTEVKKQRFRKEKDENCISIFGVFNCIEDIGKETESTIKSDAYENLT